MDSSEQQEVTASKVEEIADDSLASAEEIVPEAVEESEPVEEVVPSTETIVDEIQDTSSSAEPVEPEKPISTSPVEEIVEKPTETTEAVSEAVAQPCCGSAESSCPLMHPQVQSLIFWRNPVYSAVVLCVAASLLLLLRSATTFSIISLWMLCMLLVSVSYRVVVATVLTFQKRELVNPLAVYLTGGFPVEQDQLASAGKLVVTSTLNYFDNLRRGLLVEDVRSSVMLFFNLLGLYQMTCWLSPLTAATICLVGFFVIPPLYEKNKAQVDPVLAKAKVQVQSMLAKARALPVVGPLLFGKPKTD
ncbi:uncharacterized protein LOC135830899 [Sycon ciliatum]|uniref:uncharacterized protein LOC135830899 n=1 Tax=Sycon ciliatum TaxID=27933 RepID=UPI0031F6CC96